MESSAKYEEGDVVWIIYPGPSDHPRWKIDGPLTIDSVREHDGKFRYRILENRNLIGEVLEISETYVFSYLPDAVSSVSRLLRDNSHPRLENVTERQRHEYVLHLKKFV
jgi:hypothetical protein